MTKRFTVKKHHYEAGWWVVVDTTCRQWVVMVRSKDEANKQCAELNAQQQAVTVEAQP